MARRRRRRQEIPEEERLQTVRIERLVASGRGLAHLPDGKALMAAFAAPGELVEVTVERIHRDYVEGVVTRVIEPSRSRAEPRCSLFGDCGGCQLQHLEYPAQLAAKEGIVREQLTRIGGFVDPPVRPVTGAENPWAYRNHMRFSAGRKFGDAGLIHRRGRGLLKVTSCPIADPWVNSVLPRLQGHARGLHQIQLRRNAATASTLIAPAIDSLPDESGQDHYIEDLGGRRFRVSASSFFQVNSAQAENLAALVGGEIPRRGELLVDAYAGVGAFAALFAERFERVVAIEESTSAMRDAEVNLAGIENVEFRRGKVEALLPELEAAPTVVLLDPPRAGCAPETLDALATLAPPHDRLRFLQPHHHSPATCAASRSRATSSNGSPRSICSPRRPTSSASRASRVLAPSVSVPTVLASASPRRRELVRALLDGVVVDPAAIEERVSGEPRDAARRLAREKAAAVAPRHRDALVLGADTIVHDGERAYGKPRDAAEASAMLRKLRGKAHLVVTGIAAVSLIATASEASVAEVRLADLRDETIAAYVASGRPLDKAGAYAIQDEDVPAVAALNGCYCAVMGLPLWRLREMLVRACVSAREPHRTFLRCAACPERPLPAG